MAKHSRAIANLQNRSGKGWSCRSVDHTTLKSLLQTDATLLPKPPKELWQKLGFEDKGYDLTSFRQGLNRIKQELMLNPTDDDIEEFADYEGNYYFVC